MKINTNDFKKKLEAIQTALASSGSDELRSFMFAEGKIYGYSEQIFASTSLEGCEYEFSINGKKLLTFVKKLNAVDLEFKIDENKLKIKAGNKRITLPIEEKVRIPSNLVDAVCDKPLPSNFADAVDEALFSIGTFREDRKKHMNVIKVCEQEVLSTNNKSITCVKLDSVVDDTLFIPPGAAKHLKMINPSQYSIEGGWLCFYNETEDFLFCSRTVDASKFPILKPFTDKGEGDVQIEFPSDMVDALDTCAAFFQGVEECYHVCTIVNDGKCVTVEVSTKNGTFSEKMESSCSSEFKIFANPKYLQKTMKKKPEVFLCGGGKFLRLEKEELVHLINVGG
jgi:hypothetical protein